MIAVVTLDGLSSGIKSGGLDLCMKIRPYFSKA